MHVESTIGEGPQNWTSVEQVSSLDHQMSLAVCRLKTCAKLWWGLGMENYNMSHVENFSMCENCKKACWKFQVKKHVENFRMENCKKACWKFQNVLKTVTHVVYLKFLCVENMWWCVENCNAWCVENVYVRHVENQWKKHRPQVNKSWPPDVISSEVHVQSGAWGVPLYDEIQCIVGNGHMGPPAYRAVIGDYLQDRSFLQTQKNKIPYFLKRLAILKSWAFHAKLFVLLSTSCCKLQL